MALINQDGKYIKLYANGNYEIYATEDSRKKVKNSTPSDMILNKYHTLISELEEQKEKRYYDPLGFSALYDPLIREYDRYKYNLASYITTEEYPIMATYYPDVTHSIPEIIEAGGTMDGSDSAEAVYQHAKQVQRWGETTDA